VTDLFDDPRLTMAGLLFEAHHGLLAKLEPVMRGNGLSGLDLNALMRLSRSPGRRLRMSDLAVQTSLSTSGVTRLVDRLERSDLVRREASPTDRRTTYAALTPEGAGRLEQTLPDYIAVVDRWFAGLFTPEQLESLLTGLRTLRDAVNPDATAYTPDA
jgi:DNA-binding MarR family transcriptional regulator